MGTKDGVKCYVDLPKFSYFGDHLILFNLKSSNSLMYLIVLESVVYFLNENLLIKKI